MPTLANLENDSLHSPYKSRVKVTPQLCELCVHLGFLEQYGGCPYPMTLECGLNHWDMPKADTVRLLLGATDYGTSRL